MALVRSAVTGGPNGIRGAAPGLSAAPGAVGFELRHFLLKGEPSPLVN